MISHIVLLLILSVSIASANWLYLPDNIMTLSNKRDMSQFGIDMIRSSGETASTLCTKRSGTCSTSGSDNYHDLSGLDYSSRTGLFNGAIVTNLCPPFSFGGNPSADCISQMIPDPEFSPSEAHGAPQLGRLALSLTGVNIFGALEAGFSEGFLCDGSCPAGVDLTACVLSLENECTEAIDERPLPDACGGHAQPYHIHKDLACDYDNTASAEHSELVGIALDGRGLYGLWEGNGQKPQLDACGGHFGEVPARPELGIEATCTYHYHTTEDAPFTVGCYGPVYSLEECKAFYPECGTTFETMHNNEGTYEYNTWCTCFQHQDPGSCPENTVEEEIVQSASDLENLSFVLTSLSLFSLALLL